jgi:hypothetical protein
MSSLLESLSQHISPAVVEQIAGRIGADRSSVQGAIGAALPLLVNALGRNASDPSEAAAITNTLERDHDGSLLDNLADLVLGNAQGRQADGEGILSHVLGGRRTSVEQGVSRTSGLDMGQVARLLPILAPMVMGALGKIRQQRSLDAPAVQNLLTREQEQTSTQLGGLARLIDRDNDGSVTDELVGIGSSIFNKMFVKR